MAIHGRMKSLIGGFTYLYPHHGVTVEDDMGKGAQVALILLSLLWPGSNAELGPPPLRGIRSQILMVTQSPVRALGFYFSIRICQ